MAETRGLRLSSVTGHFGPTSTRQHIGRHYGQARVARIPQRFLIEKYVPCTPFGHRFCVSRRGIVRDGTLEDGSAAKFGKFTYFLVVSVCDGTVLLLRSASKLDLFSPGGVWLCKLAKDPDVGTGFGCRWREKLSRLQ